MSDADRERVVAHLQAAVGEGRLTLDEFQERVDGVLRSRTFGEIEPYLADLPTVPTVTAAALVQPREYAELRATAAPLRRTGRWNVPRRLLVRNKAGAVKLDFTEAVIGFPVIEVVLDVLAGSTTLVLPEGASADADDVEMIAGSLSVRKIPVEPGTGPHFVVTGSNKSGSVIIRRQRRFWRWRW